ncbi:hypothetical protein DXG03_008897 [Asterophora parasitica]|uniref:glycerol-3-phosphate dehydrogenase (NAD(+)) n=1 Tax=Asterophora parasitica TaxID=117018 RepID=A0A9P7GBN4_9AGAR|nr:hypothetical protein DXG03_008897 [Asterophora parasitica]
MTGVKDHPTTRSRVLVFGAGNFGSCLASHLGDSQHDVYMWAREESTVKYFNEHHRNPLYLRDHQFPSNITAVGPELPGKELINTMDVLLFAIPTQFLSRDLRLRKKVLRDLCEGVRVMINPPSLTVVERQPTSVSVASFTESEANKASTLFHQPHFRCYTGADPIGIELSGALKNVYAIAAGMSDGLGFENNTRASKGESLDTIMKTLGSVAEGVSTTKGVKTIIDELGVNAPIASSVSRRLTAER